MNDENYAHCSESSDGKHVPAPAPVHEVDMPDGYFTVQCKACGQTTGYPMPDADDIDWG